MSMMSDAGGECRQVACSLHPLATFLVQCVHANTARKRSCYYIIINMLLLLKELHFNTVEI